MPWSSFSGWRRGGDGGGNRPELPLSDVTRAITRRRSAMPGVEQVALE
jgi:hypothetical protein